MMVATDNKEQNNRVASEEAEECGGRQPGLLQQPSGNNYLLAAGAAVQRVKRLPVTPALPITTWVQVPVALLPIQLPVKMPGKAAKDGPSDWAPAAQVGDLDGVPSS